MGRLRAEPKTSFDEAVEYGPVRFAAVSVSRPVSASTEESGIRLRVRGVEIEIAPEFCSRTLRRLLGVLEAS